MEQNILLVEDEEALRMTLGDRLRREGYSVDYASDGETGFQKATSLPFDMMILDIMLPGRNGLDLCRDIRLSGLGTPVLLLTALRETAYRVAAHKVGADDYVTKPFEMLELIARVEALLRRAPARRANLQDLKPSQKTSTQHPQMSESTTASGQDFLIDQITPQERKLREELFERLAAHKDSPRLAEIVPGLRTILDEEQHSPQTPRRLGLLSTAEGVINFLEEIVEEMRSPRRRR